MQVVSFSPCTYLAYTLSSNYDLKHEQAEMTIGQSQTDEGGEVGAELSISIKQFAKLDIQLIYAAQSWGVDLYEWRIV